MNKHEPWQEGFDWHVQIFNNGVWEQHFRCFAQDALTAMRHFERFGNWPAKELAVKVSKNKVRVVSPTHEGWYPFFEVPLLSAETKE